MNSTMLNAVGLILVGVWMLIEALGSVSKTGDIIFAILVIVLAVVALLLAWGVPRRGPVR